MKKYTITWGELHETSVMANDEEEALMIWEDGEYQDNYVANCIQPEIKSLEPISDKDVIRDENGDEIETL